MHSVAKGKQWFHCCAEGFAYGMRCHNRHAEAKGYGVDAASGLAHSVESTAANVHEPNITAERLHGYERHIYGVAAGFCAAVADMAGNCFAEAVGYEKRGDFQDCEAEFRTAMKPGQRRVLP